MSLPKSVVNLSDQISSLPGIGPKLSTRIALYLALRNKNLALGLSKSLEDVISAVHPCSICGNITDKDECYICSATDRDKSKLMIVEDSLDLENINQTGYFNGFFHVLGGLISPVNGIGPDDITIDSLVSRIKTTEFTEIVFALNPTIEGDATTLYIKSLLENSGLEIETTRLAKGIPSGGDIEFASSQTITDSFNSRIKF